MIELAVTGNIACGKNLVGEILHSKGVPVIDTDQSVREILRSENFHSLQVASLVPAAVLTGAEREVHGFLDRRTIAGSIFASPSLKSALEIILHPAVYAMTRDFFDSREAEGEAIAACLIPLLFETASQDRYSRTWLVYCRPDIQRLRLASRNPSLTEEELSSRIDSQLPQEQKKALVDCVIDNSGLRDETERQVSVCLGKLEA